MKIQESCPNFAEELTYHGVEIHLQPGSTARDGLDLLGITGGLESVALPADRCPRVGHIRIRSGQYRRKYLLNHFKPVKA